MSSNEQPWSIHSFDPSAFDEEDDSYIGSYVVSFLQLEVYANPMRHGRHLFVQTNALIDYITGNRGLFKDFYRDVREKITGNKKSTSTKKSNTTILSTPKTPKGKRSRPVDNLPGDKDGFLSEVWGDLYAQLDGSVDHIHDTIIQSELVDTKENDDSPILMHVTNLFVVAAYFRVRYITAMNKCEALSSSDTLGPKGNGVDIPTLVKRCFWRNNTLALARIIYLWELVDGSIKDLNPKDVPADEIDASAFLSSWSRGVAQDTLQEPHAKRLKQSDDGGDMAKAIVYDDDDKTIEYKDIVTPYNPKPSKMHLEALTNVILQCIKTFPQNDDNGMDINTILPHIDRRFVLAGVKELEDEGYIYSTIDEHHYLATSPMVTSTKVPPESSRKLFLQSPAREPLQEVLLHAGTVPLQLVGPNVKPFESRPTRIVTHADYITGEVEIKFHIKKADGRTVGSMKEIQTIMCNIRDALENDVAQPPKIHLPPAALAHPPRSMSPEY